MSALAHPKCVVWMRPRKNDVRVLETDGDGQPYRIWSADLWECPECGEQVVTGFGLDPLAVRHQPEFAAELARGVDVTISGRLRALPEVPS